MTADIVERVRRSSRYRSVDAALVARLAAEELPKSRNADDAVKRAVARASQTVRQLRWFQVLDTRGHIEDGEIAHWQVTIKVGFTLEED